MNKHEKEALHSLFKEVSPRKGEHPVLITVYDCLGLILKGKAKMAVELIESTRQVYPLKEDSS